MDRTARRLPCTAHPAPGLAAALALTAIVSATPTARADTSTTVSSTTTIADSSSSWSSKSTSWGDFGIGFGVGYSLSSNSTGSDKKAKAYGSVSGEVFGYTHSIGGMSLTAGSGLGSTVTLTPGLSVAGIDVAVSIPVNNVTGEFEKCLDFFGEEASVEIVVVEVEAKLVASGCFGLSFSSSASNSGAQSALSATATPYESVAAVGEITIGSGAFSTGITGTLNLIKASEPITASLVFVPSTKVLTYGINGLLTLETLSGSIELWAKALFLKYTKTLASWKGISLLNKVLFTDSIPVAAGATIDLSSLDTAQSSYLYTDASNLPESGSAYVWYRASDDSGTGKSQIGTSSDWTLTDADNGKYLMFCVTPRNGKNYGTQECSDWSYVGRLFEMFKNGSYGGASTYIAYENQESGKCAAISGSWKDVLSSYKFYAPVAYNGTLVIYKDANCTGSQIKRYLSANGSDLISSMSGTFGSSWQDAASSFRFVWNDSVTASSATLTISGNKASGSYVFETTSDVSESGSSYTISRADDANGTNATTIITSNNWTLMTSDNNKYLRFCVTPSNGFTTGAQVCSSWTAVGHLLEMWKDNLSGTNVNVAYENMGWGSCVNLSDYSFNDALTSLVFNPPSGKAATLWLYKDGNCGGSQGTLTAAANTVMTVSSIGSTMGSSWNDSVTSFKVTW